MTKGQRASGAPPVPVFDSSLCQAKRRRLILTAAILASALGFIDGTVVAIAMPAIRETLGASLSDAQWISNSYMLTLSALILVGGAFGDRFGLARIFAGGIALFVLASIACALSPDPEFLIFARAIQGIGAAFMVPGSLAIIARAYPREERGRAIGIWAAASAMTTALGPVLGGLALTLAGPEAWRWIFAINLPLGALALWLLRRAVQHDRSHPERPVDLPGAALAIIGLGLVSWALTGIEPGESAPWPLFAMGLGVLAVFLAFEARSSHPMMPLGLFANIGFAAANLLTFTLYFGLSAVLFFLPMVVIAGWGISEINAAAAFVPLSVFIFALSGPVGKWADVIGPGPLIAAGSALVAVGYGALALTFAEQEFWFRVLPAMILVGIGMAFVVGPLSTAVMAAADEDTSGTASGINNAVARIAGLVAVAAIGSLAAVLYARAGGPASFGAAAPGEAHLFAMNSAFTAIAWITAALSAVSAVIAGLGIRLAAAP